MKMKENTRREWTRRGKGFPTGKRILIGIFLLVVITLIPKGVPSPALFAQSDNASPRLSLKATPSKVYLGKAFQLAVTLDNAFTETPPEMDYLTSEFQVEYLGIQPRNSSLRIVINGKTRTEEKRGVAFFYRLTPKNAGKIQIDSPEMMVDGAPVHADPILIEVIPPTGQELVQLELTTNVESVYPLTPFDVTLSVYVKELPGRYAKSDPILTLSRQVAIPELTIPWGKDEELPSGVTPVKNWEGWISPYRKNEGGFAINGLRLNDPFDFGWAFGNSQQAPLTFFSKPTKVERTDEDGKTALYWRYDFTRRFVAEQTGPIDFDAASLQGTFVIPDREKPESGKLESVEVYVLSPSRTMMVKDVPVEGRPDNYVGAFGQFILRTDITPEKAKVGEAMTLTMTLKGRGSVLNVTPPKLEENEELTRNFRIYPPSEETEDGLVRWTWSLRPVVEGEITFPSLEISYFDVSSEEFVTLHSQEIPLTIEENGGTAPTGFPTSGVDSTSSPTGMERSASGIFGNLTRPRFRPSLLGNVRTVPLQGWLVSAGVCYLATLLIWGSVGLSRRKSESARSQLNHAIEEGRGLVMEGMTEMASGKRDSILSGSRKIARGFLTPVADHFTARPDAVTGKEMEELIGDLLAHWNEGDPRRVTLTDLSTLLAKIDQIQFAFETPSAESLKKIPILYDRWGKLLIDLGKDKRKDGKPFDDDHGNGHHRTGRADGPKPGIGTRLLLGFLSFGLIIFLSGCSGPSSSEARQRFDEAVRLFEEADNESGGTSLDEATGEETPSMASEEKFRKIAAIYEGLRESGVETGPILFNQGNAYWRAGETPQALAAWRKAEKYLPGNPYLRANRETLVSTSPKKPFLGKILFWQDWLSWDGKGVLFLLGTLATCVGTLVFLFGKRFPRFVAVARPVVWTGILLSLFFGLSLYVDHQRYDLGNHGILTTEEGIVRKGGSARYEPLFRDPLPKLTEFTILEKRSGWLRVRFADGQTGWLPESDVLIY